MLPEEERGIGNAPGEFLPASRILARERAVACRALREDGDAFVFGKDPGVVRLGFFKGLAEAAQLGRGAAAGLPPGDMDGEAEPLQRRNKAQGSIDIDQAPEAPREQGDLAGGGAFLRIHMLRKQQVQGFDRKLRKAALTCESGKGVRQMSHRAFPVERKKLLRPAESGEALFQQGSVGEQC